MEKMEIISTSTASSEMLSEIVNNGTKSNRVPYMGCQSLLYQNKINKESHSRHETCRSADCCDFKSSYIPTSILIHQDSPQSIPSFSTYYSDRTMVDKRSSSNDTSHDLGNCSDVYDLPPCEHSANDFQSPFAYQTQTFSGLRKRPSLLKRQSRLPSNPSLNGNKNLLTLCVGSRSPASKNREEFNYELPEAEHYASNGSPVFMSLPTRNSYQPINSWEKFFTSFSVRTDIEFHWTRASLKKPVLTYMDKCHWKSAIKCFNVIQKYMGDRRTRKPPSELIAILNKHISSQQNLQDEILVQICKQTIKNPDFRSRSRGWELIAECLVQFAPSVKLLPYLDGFILTSIDEEELKTSLPMNSCLSNLRKCQSNLSGIKEALNGKIHQSLTSSARQNSYQGRQRSLSENMQLAAKEPMSFFHQSLQAVMKQQSVYMPTEKIPLVLSTICIQLAEDFEETDSFISLYRSFYTPKDLVDEVSRLDQLCCAICQSGQPRANENPLYVPLISLQLLIYWFENLSSPVISQQMAFMSSFSLKDLSKINKQVVSFVAEFLQVHVISKSKDTVRNMASFLCTLIFQLPRDKFYPLDEPKDSVYLKIILNVFKGL